MNRICADIKCPYFTSEAESIIRCEGPEMGTKNIMRFPDEKSKLLYMEKHCTEYPNNCNICIAAEKKYN
jgi:hypothetical protein